MNSTDDGQSLSSRAGIRICAALATLLACLLAESSAGASMVILANRSAQVVDVQIAATDGAPITRKLAPLDHVALPSTGVVPIEFASASGKKQYGLAPPGIYCFVNGAGSAVELTRIDIRPTDAAAAVGEMAAAPIDRKRLGAAATIPVKILVDDNEVTRRESWEPRLRQRIEAASEILEAAAGIRLVVVAAEVWKSDNKITDFDQSLREFETAVRPLPAGLAIGFTSQYPVRAGRQKLGATRAPLHPYILMREYGPRIVEREKLEVLVHELGHFLGAAHSPELNSVMRPVLGDDQVNLLRFRIVFDPLNALAINVVAQQWRDRHVRALYQMDSHARSTLADVYRVLSEVDPEDPAAKNYLRLLEETDFSNAARGTAAVLEVLAAVDSQPEAFKESPQERADRSIRAAAAAAARLPAESSLDSLLTALAVAYGEPDALPGAAGKVKAPTLQWRAWLGDDEKMFGRYFTAAALARGGGAAATEAACLARQVNAMRNGGTFSIAELKAELAGIRLAEELISGVTSVSALARGFSAKQRIPDAGDKSPLSAAEFAERYGTVYDPRFQAELARLRR